MELKFLGKGGAFDNETNSSAYIVNGDGILFIDMGENVFEKAKTVLQTLVDKNIEIGIAITHTHSDHIGSLGTFILFCRYVLKKKVHLFTGSEDQLTHVKALLHIFGVDKTMYSESKNYFNGLNIDFVKTTHVDDFDCFGIMIYRDSKYTTYYSGDSNSIPTVVQQELLQGNIKKFYQDITLADYPGNVHYNLDKFVNDFPAGAVEKTEVYFYHNAVFDPTQEVDLSNMKLQSSSVTVLTRENVSDVLKTVFDKVNLKENKIVEVSEVEGGLELEHVSGIKRIIKFGDKIMINQVGRFIFF
ncbi:MAG: MBL fold metallo-hydrolase [Sarcina sp.]